MRLIKEVNLQEVNRALDDVHRELSRLRGRSGVSPFHGDIDLQGHVVSNSGKASRAQDLITKGVLDAAIETNTTTIINQAGASAWIRVNVALSGTVDGVNKTFTVPEEILGGTKIALFDGFVRLRRVAGTPDLMEYVLDGQVATLGSAPTTGSRVAADYLTPRPASPIFDEVPAGAQNGVNTAFTLAYEPSAASDVTLFSGGGVMERVEAAPLPPDQYVIQGQTITTGWAPLSTDDLKADYPVKEAGNFRWGDELEGNRNGSNQTFYLDEEPSGTNISIYRSQIRLTRVAAATTSLEYSISGKTVTMGTALAADEGVPVANYEVPLGGEITWSGPGWVAGTPGGDMIATTLAEFWQLPQEGLNGFMGGQN